MAEDGSSREFEVETSSDLKVTMSISMEVAELPDTPAVGRWRERMRTDPLFRALKIAHWQWVIDESKSRGWLVPPNATGGLEFYGRIHEEWLRECQRIDPDGWGAGEQRD